MAQGAKEGQGECDSWVGYPTVLTCYCWLLLEKSRVQSTLLCAGGCMGASGVANSTCENWALLTATTRADFYKIIYRPMEERPGDLAVVPGPIETEDLSTPHRGTDQKTLNGQRLGVPSAWNQHR